MSFATPADRKWIWLYSEATRLVRAAEQGGDAEHQELHNLIDELVRLHREMGPVVYGSGWYCHRKFDR